MRRLRALLGWACPTCNHRNPPIRMQCRQCRRNRPLGA
jgi:ribosomal protein L40E